LRGQSQKCPKRQVIIAQIHLSHSLVHRIVFAARLDFDRPESQGWVKALLLTTRRIAPWLRGKAQHGHTEPVIGSARWQTLAGPGSFAHLWIATFRCEGSDMGERQGGLCIVSQRCLLMPGGAGAIPNSGPLSPCRRTVVPRGQNRRRRLCKSSCRDGWFCSPDDAQSQRPDQTRRPRKEAVSTGPLSFGCRWLWSAV